ncbi:zf-HC2 domain-containing protein, partial [Micromonospora aurantiaca]|nr:zf-HC2 domain-containing protein [Micromonospora aurantiaca]
AAATDALLRPATMPAWAAAAVVFTLLTALRAEHLRRPAG